MYPIRANSLALSLALVLAASPLAASTVMAKELTWTAQFSLPLVDVVPNYVSQSASYAIWTTTDGYLTPGTMVRISFPAGTTFPSVPMLATLSAGAAWIFMKFTDSSVTASNAYARFSPNEVTVTGYTMDVLDRSISISIPAAVYPGKLYFRFDKTYSGIRNPWLTGTTQLLVYDPSGRPLRSSQYVIVTTNAQVEGYGYGSLTGTVRTGTVTNGQLLPGALVMATTSGAASHPVSAGPRTIYSDVMSTTNNSFTTAVKADGSYSFVVPSGAYNVIVRAWRGVTVTGGAAKFVSSSVQSRTVSSGQIVPLNFDNVPTFTP